MSSTTDPLFQLKDVRKQYGDAVVVNIKSLEIPAGELLCLLGPTGAGKSTLLRLFAAVEQPTSGDVLYHKSPLRLDSPLATTRPITMVFQRPILLAGTVRSNVEYGLRLWGDKDALSSKVDDILEVLGLTKLAAHSAQTLSGGQTQLVALARALVLEPEVLLLDEPTANLDPAHVALVERVIQDDFQQRKTTVIWATHNLFQARRVAQRAALLLNGHLIEAAATDQFFESPSDPRTRDFVEGKMIY